MNLERGKQKAQKSTLKSPEQYLKTDELNQNRNAKSPENPFPVQIS